MMFRNKGMHVEDDNFNTALYWETWFSRHGSDGLVVGIDNLSGLFQA